MASFHSPMIFNRIRGPSNPLRLQRRWARVHDVRFVATRGDSKSILEKYRDKLDKKAKELVLVLSVCAWELILALEKAISRLILSKKHIKTKSQNYDGRLLLSHLQHLRRRNQPCNNLHRQYLSRNHQARSAMQALTPLPLESSLYQPTLI